MYEKANWHKASDGDELKPNPALKNLDRLVGTWAISGEAHGYVSFNWMEGGFFMVQDIDLIGTKGIEFIGYEKDSGTLKSHYFDNKGQVLECSYDVSKTEYTVSVDMSVLKGNFCGKFGNQGNTITGRWEWIKDGKEMGYQVIMTKVG